MSRTEGEDCPPFREFELGDEEFRFLASFLSRETGILLNPHKRQMVCGRLVKRLRALGIASFADYCRLLDGPRAAGEIQNLVNAITTNITQFFREPHHFEHLSRTLATRQAQGGGARLRLWSAGCSSGEEPHSMAMVLADILKGAARDALILATDIDTNMLIRGQTAIYPSEGIEHVPQTYRKRFLRRIANASGKMQVSEDIRRLVRFQHLNLHDVWPMKGPFDAIFCRNVVIYFDKAIQRRLFDRFADLLHMGGYLYLGHAESLIGVSDRFEVADKTVYRRIR